MAWSINPDASRGAAFWNVVWDRPYVRYEGHHQLLWKEIKARSKGKILDLACGSASCWKDFNGDITGIDYSVSGVREARKNCPSGRFYVGDAFAVPLPGPYDTIVACGLVNYYRDLSKLKHELTRLALPGSKILITINVINDFPDRSWDIRLIEAEFRELGKIEALFFEKVGWLVVIDSGSTV